LARRRNSQPQKPGSHQCVEILSEGHLQMQFCGTAS
jgi:hypothetical protein